MSCGKGTGMELEMITEITRSGTFFNYPFHVKALYKILNRSGVDVRYNWSKGHVLNEESEF